MKLYYDNFITCEIKNEYLFLFFVITLFIITWSDGWMGNALTCHHESEGAQFFIVTLYSCLHKGGRPPYKPRRAWLRL